MERYHPLAELASRDVVARAITREGMGPEPGEVKVVHLDMRHVKGVDLHRRFPGISEFLARYGLDLQSDLIPVRPAAHYLMGGIRTDLFGRTTLRGLYAAGEAACTGVHGANRLASNSLLEGLVFGARAAQSMLADRLPLVAADAPNCPTEPLSRDENEQAEIHIAYLQHAMWANAGLLRSEATLIEGMRAQADTAERLARLAQPGKASRRLAEAQAMSCVACAILNASLARTESRGAHFRKDFPKRDDEHFRKHSVLSNDGTGEVRIAFQQW